MLLEIDSLFTLLSGHIPIQLVATIPYLPRLLAILRLLVRCSCVGVCVAFSHWEISMHHCSISDEDVYRGAGGRIHQRWWFSWQGEPIYESDSPGVNPGRPEKEMEDLALKQEQNDDCIYLVKLSRPGPPKGSCLAGKWDPFIAGKSRGGEIL